MAGKKQSNAWNINDNTIRNWKRWLVGLGFLLTFVCVGYWRLRPKTADERLQSVKAESREENDVIVAKLENELKLLEAKEKQKRSDDSKRQELAKQRIATQEALESAQVNRMALCDDLFGKIELSPDSSIQLSDFLMESGVTLELRGPNLNKILSHLAEKDWLAIVNLVLEKNYPELPDGREIATAADRLKKYEFQVLLRTESQLIRDSVSKPEFGRLLAALNVTSSATHDVLELEEKHSWNHHPDGIGFTQVWSPNQGSTIVTLVPLSEFNAKQEEFRQSFAQRLSYLNEKSRLGEIESDLLPDLRQATVQSTKDSIAAWALTRSIDLDDKRIASFDPGNKLFTLPKRGQYLGIAKSPGTKEEGGAQIVFCEDIVAWVNGTEIGALYVRDRSHPVEKEGFYVFKDQRNGLFVVRANSELMYHASVFVGSKANCQTLQEALDGASDSREVSGKWQNEDSRLTGYTITGAYSDPDSKKQWKAILTKHAPACLEKGIRRTDANLNFVKNGDFEEGGKPTANPANWFIWPKGADKYSSVAAQAKNGHCLSHFYWRDYLVYTGQEFAVPNGKYRLVFSVLSSGGQIDAHAVVKGFGKSELRTPPFGGQPSLKQMSIENIEVTNGKCQVGFSSNAKAGQWINIDDVRLERVAK